MSNRHLFFLSSYCFYIGLVSNSMEMRMGYCVIPDVRLLIGLSSSDISDNDLQELIDLATNMIIEDLTLSVRDEEPVGSIDGCNTTFQVANCPIADVSGNKTVGSEDVTVYQWLDEDDPSTKSSVSVSAVYPRDGVVVLSSAPTSTVRKLSVDYSYTLEGNINWELVKQACAYLVGYIFCIKKFTVIPESQSRGPLRFRYYTKPYNEYLNRYYEIMNLVKSKIGIKKTADNMELKRSRL